MVENWNRTITRRQALAVATLLGAGANRHAFAAAPNIKIGVPDWTLKQSAKIESFAVAQKIGFEGVEVSVNEAPGNSGRLEPFSEETCQRYLAESKKRGVAIACTRINGFSKNLEPGTAVKFLAEGCRVTGRLGVKAMLAPCFHIATDNEIDRMGRILREAAPAAEEAGAIIALENSNTASENARMMDQAGSRAVQVFYDVGNATSFGYNIIDEMLWLGKEKICMFHLKDRPRPARRLGEGTVDFVKVFQTMAKMGYEGWADVEMGVTDALVQELGQDLAFVRNTLARM